MRKMLIVSSIVLSCIFCTAITSVMASNHLEKATFAGGCFWCMEHPFDQIPGVVSVTSGYTGGWKKNPSYEEVSAGGTGHAESIQIVYDSSKVSYEKLLEVFWHNIDPTARDRQFCDSGHQYRSAIFYHNEEQHKLALRTKALLEKNQNFKEPVVTEIVEATQFYPAEDYHQNYYRENPNQGYCRMVIDPKIRKFHKEFQAKLKEPASQAG